MEPNVEITQKPEVKFIYATHSLENFDNVWKEAQNADIILMEAVGLDEETRKQAEELINWASHDPNPQIKRNTIKMLSNHDESIDFSTRLTENVIMNGKNLYYIDEPENGMGGNMIDKRTNL